MDLFQLEILSGSKSNTHKKSKNPKTLRPRSYTIFASNKSKMRISVLSMKTRGTCQRRTMNLLNRLEISLKWAGYQLSKNRRSFRRRPWTQPFKRATLDPGNQLASLITLGSRWANKNLWIRWMARKNTVRLKLLRVLAKRMKIRWKMMTKNPIKTYS